MQGATTEAMAALVERLERWYRWQRLAELLWQRGR